MRVTFAKTRWVQVLVGGVVLFIATEQAFRLTGNPNYFPTVLLLGSFVMPVAFVTYMYGRESTLDTHTESPLGSVILSFFVGGAVGVVIAGILEFQTLSGLTPASLFGVGLIEEAAKLILPIFLFLRGRFRSEMDGILFGVAAGMGFASLETMGYGLVVFVNSLGDINELEQVLLLRGILSPVGHAAWTGLVCGILWRERQRKGCGLLSLAAFGAFIAAVILHTLWNLSNSIEGQSTASVVYSSLGNVAVAVVSLTLLIRRLRESRRFSVSSTSNSSPGA